MLICPIFRSNLQIYFMRGEKNSHEPTTTTYQEKNLASANEDNKELDRLIEKAIVEDPELKELLGIGEEIKIPKGKEQDKPQYVGEEHPKKFEYIGEQPREVNKSSYSLVSFRTEA